MQIKCSSVKISSPHDNILVKLYCMSMSILFKNDIYDSADKTN